VEHGLGIIADALVAVRQVVQLGGAELLPVEDLGPIKVLVLGTGGHNDLLHAIRHFLGVVVGFFFCLTLPRTLLLQNSLFYFYGDLYVTFPWLPPINAAKRITQQTPVNRTIKVFS